MVIIITGASKGIGRAVAEKFAAVGYTLVLCAREMEGLRRAANAIAEKYGCAVYVQAADISIKQQAVAFGKWALQAAGTPDVVVNNAAWFINSSIHNEDEGVLEQMLATNLGGAYHLTRAVLPAMMQEEKGHVFNIGSIASRQGSANGGSYSISKFALDGFTKNLREEMKPYHIKVTGVYPGSVYTESWHGEDVAPETLMQPQDIAALIYTTSHLSFQACVEDIVIKPF